MNVNGVEHEIPLTPDRSLLTVLREELDLTGAKPGCGEGACGACTVLVDGEPQRACITPIGAAANRSITTIEGLATAGALHPVQRAFAETGGMQCGYCTSGMILGTVALLAKQEKPSDADIVSALDGNLCRCCAYPAIMRAVQRAVELQATPHPDPPPQGEREVPFSETSGPWDLMEPQERDYFTLLGDGLVVVLPPSQGDWWTSGGAWLHVGANGIVTAFTGKVDVGQDNRTALSMLVAEELRVPLEAVTLIMGDTDVCPFDMGTFGSRSTPDAGQALRSTAAAARRLLVRMAGDRDPIDYASLLENVRRLETVGRRPALTRPAKWRIAGQPVSRLDAVDIVSGVKRYPTDVARPNMLYGRVLRPPAFGASLSAVDLTAARQIDGVTVVQDDSFIGVAANDSVTANRALAAIDAQWTAKPQPAERELEPYLRKHPVESFGWDGPVHEERGNLARALKSAPVRLEATYTIPYVAHAPLETRAVVAEWSGDRLTIWTGSQRPFGVREAVAEALQIPETQVRVVVPLTGGGFGGKHTLEVAIQAAKLARAAGRPVKIRWTREEEFKWAYLRPAAVIDVRSGASTDGRLTAWEFTNINAGSPALETPYNVENVRLEFQPAASPLAQGSYRALAATANTFARESHMDELAHRLDQDPLEFRLAHLEDERLAGVFRAVADRVDWGRRARGSGKGIGIAGGVEKDGHVATAVEIAAEPGRGLEIRRIVTAFDCGAIVNPRNLRNQVEGATIMGLGAALFEAVHFDNGVITNAAFSRYRVPRFSDVPPIEVVLIDRKQEAPAGAGETPIIAVAPAVANAIFEATGERLRSLPLTPDAGRDSFGS